MDLVWINTTCPESTLAMLKHELETGIEVVRDGDRILPRLPSYAGELNQVWTNLVDNLGLDICWRIVVQRHHGRPALHLDLGRYPLPGAAAPGPARVTPWAQTGSRRSPPWAATAQITNTFKMMISSDQNG